MFQAGFEPQKVGLRDRISPICTLSQNGYGAWRSLTKPNRAGLFHEICICLMAFKLSILAYLLGFPSGIIR